MHILLIEDNPADARLVHEALVEARLACKLNWKNTGGDALAFLSETVTADPASAPDLILLDLNLQHIPVIVLSSSVAKTDVMDAYRAHANAYVAKPTHFSQFVALIASINTYWVGAVLLPSKMV